VKDHVLNEISHLKKQSKHFFSVGRSQMQYIKHWKIYVLYRGRNS